MSAPIHDGAPPATTALATADRGNGAWVTSIPADISVPQLIALAIHNGMAATELERLVALRDRELDRAAVEAFSRARAAFKLRCPPIKKNKTAKITSRRSGTEYSYTYAELDEIDRTVTPILAEVGLSFSFGSAQLSEDQKILSVPCTLLHELGHSETASFPVPVESESGMSPQQKFGSASTYAKRMALIAVLGLTTTDEDTDARGEADPTTLSDEQADAIAERVKEVGAPLDGFLAHMKVQKIAHIRRADYDRAMAALEVYASKHPHAAAPATPQGGRR